MFPQWQRSCCWPAWLCCWHRQASAGEKHSWPPCLCSSSVWVLHTGNGRNLMQTNTSSSSSSQHLDLFVLCPLSLPATRGNEQLPVLHPQAILEDHRPRFNIHSYGLKDQASVRQVKATLLSQRLVFFGQTAAWCLIQDWAHCQLATDTESSSILTPEHAPKLTKFGTHFKNWTHFILLKNCSYLLNSAPCKHRVPAEPSPKVTKTLNKEKFCVPTFHILSLIHCDFCPHTQKKQHLINIVPCSPSPLAQWLQLTPEDWTDVSMNPPNTHLSLCKQFDVVLL